MLAVFGANSYPIDRPQKWFINDGALTPPYLIAHRTPLPKRLQEITLRKGLSAYKQRGKREIRPESQRLESTHPI